jgi:hypothetical protein
MRKDPALTAMVHVIGRNVANRLVDPLVVLEVHEANNGSIELPGAVMILKPHHVLHRAVIALDLTLRRRVGCSNRSPACIRM